MSPIKAHQIVDKAAYYALDYSNAVQVYQRKSEIAMIEIASSVLGVPRSMVGSISKPSSLDFQWVGVTDTRNERGGLFQ